MSIVITSDNNGALSLANFPSGFLKSTNSVLSGVLSIDTPDLSNGLQSNLNVMHNDVSDIKSNLTVLQTQVSNLSLDTGVTTKLNDIEAQLGTQSTYNTNVNSRLGGLSYDIRILGEQTSANVSAISSNVSAISSNVSALQALVWPDQQEIADLQSNVTTIKSNISTLNGDLSNIFTSVKSNISILEANVNVLLNMVAPEQLQVSNIQSNVNALKNDVLTIQSNILTLNNNVLEIPNIKSNVTALKSNVTIAENTIASLVNAGAAMQSNVTSLQSNVSTLKNSWPVLQNMVITHEGGIYDLNANVTLLQSNVSTLNNTVLAIPNIQSNVSSLQSNVSALQTNVSSLQTNMTSAQSNIVTLNTNVTDMQSNILTLNNNVTSIKSGSGFIMQNYDTNLNNFAISWRVLNNSPVYNYAGSGITCSGDGKVVIKYNNNNSYISRDYGVSFTIMSNIGSGIKLVKSSFNGSYIVFASTNGSIYIYNTIKNTTITQGIIVNGIDISAYGDLIIATSGSSIYISTDYGVTFTVKASAPYNYISISANGADWWSMSSSGQLRQSINNGTTWVVKKTGSAITDPIIISGNGKYGLTYNINSPGLFLIGDNTMFTAISALSAIYFNGAAISYDGKYMVASAANTGGLIYYSKDYGATWGTIGLSGEMNCVCMSYDGRHIYVAGNDQPVHRTSEILNIVTTSTPIDIPCDGDIYLDKLANKLFIYCNNVWTSINLT